MVARHGSRRECGGGNAFVPCPLSAARDSVLNPALHPRWHLERDVDRTMLGTIAAGGAFRERARRPILEVRPMVDTYRAIPVRDARTTIAIGIGSDACMARELLDLARGLAGHLDRDAVDEASERAIDEALEAAVAAVLPQIVDVLDAELTPRLEALPLRTRMVLANSRRMRDLGLD